MYAREVVSALEQRGNMREQIEQLIAEINTERAECVEIMNNHPELTYANYEFVDGKRVALTWAFDRLTAILADSMPVSGEIDTVDRV